MSEAIESGAHIQLFARTANSEVQWRLLSGNNREIGRSALSYPDAETCRVEIKELQTISEELESGVRRMSSNEWRWRLTKDGKLVAASSRGFDRLIRCEQGLAHFLAQLTEADISLSVMISSSRRW